MENYTHHKSLKMQILIYIIIIIEGIYILLVLFNDHYPTSVC